jgi:hypothetical protein
MLQRVIYVSRSLIGADQLRLGPLVSSSATRNTAADVTGMLWADGESFAQVLEGDPDDVDMIMKRIRADQRHTDIFVLLDRPVSSRQFGTWAMRRARYDDASVHATTFMIGFAMGERAGPAKRLYDTILANDGQRF